MTSSFVADDIVVTGSFNFSNHARGNAENTIPPQGPAGIADVL